MIRGNRELLTKGSNTYAGKVLDVDNEAYQNLIEVEAGVKY